MAKHQAPDAPGMKGYRSRDLTGPLREKRSDTLIGTIEREYRVDLNARSDMKLGTLLERRGVTSLKQLLGRKPSR